MIEDPYKVLGISHDATKDEIKRAYRRKAKEYHPDLHPDDPVAEEKMNEVNEAYDMLSNPEKYEKERQKTASSHREEDRNPYSSFGDFNFEDIFGFSGRDYGMFRARIKPDDSPDIRQAIDFINARQFQYANATLNSILNRDRNARWYYLSALANEGMGNTLLAAEQIDKAIQMEPDNRQYQEIRQQLHQTGDTYNEMGRDFQKYAEGMNKLCIGFCATQFFCMFCFR